MSDAIREGRTSAFGLPQTLLLLAATAAAAVLAKAMLMEQPLGLRTLTLAAIAAAGAVLAALPLALALGWLAASWRPWLRGGVAALWMLAGFVPATMFAFAFENRVIEGHIEADSVTDLQAVELFWTLFGGMGLFTPTGLAYLLPWPLAVVAFAAFLCFYRWPTPDSGARR